MDLKKVKPKSQEIDGILLLDKPEGLSSNAALQKIKRLFNAQKAGHTGSLDPLATGMLPICLGEATKFAQYLLNADKTYEACGVLGIKTNTGDSTGSVMSQNLAVSIAQSELSLAINSFRGAILQTPPMFSALKHKGQPLYQYARNDLTVEREPREVNIYDLSLLSYKKNKFVIRVHCSKGTYIRTLIEDIGAKLGVGAHVSALRRLSVGGFEEEKIYTLDELNQKSSRELLDCLLDLDRGICHLPCVNLTSVEALSLQQGKRLSKTFFADYEGKVRLKNESSQFLGIGDHHKTYPGYLVAVRLLKITGCS